MNMKKTLFGLGLITMLGGCGGGQKEPGDPNVIGLEQSTPNSNAKVSPCVVEVPCDEPELDYLVETSDINKPKKFYDFCDSTVTIVASSCGNDGPVYNVRPLTELHGTEVLEKNAAYEKYKAAWGMK